MQIIKDFEVGQQLGVTGHFSKVYRCRRKSDKKILAVKGICKSRFYRLNTARTQREALLCAMEEELDVTRAIKGQNLYIVNTEAIYQDKSMLCVVTQQCHGGNLFDRVLKKYKNGEHLSEHYVSNILKMIGDALKYMYVVRTIVHCNLRPENILFLSKRDDSPIKIVDFGFSKVLPRLHSQFELNDTPYYTAPDILEGHYSHCVDMWSVGVIMFVMLFGFPPFYINPQKYYGTNERQALYTLVC